MLGLDWTAHRSLLVLLMSRRILLLETAEIRELRGCKRGWCSSLEWAAEQQLRGQKWCEIHFESCSRGAHVVVVLMRRPSERARVDGHVRPTGMSVSVSSGVMLIRGISAMRKARMVVVDVRL